MRARRADCTRPAVFTRLSAALVRVADFCIPVNPTEADLELYRLRAAVYPDERRFRFFGYDFCAPSDGYFDELRSYGSHIAESFDAMLVYDPETATLTEVPASGKNLVWRLQRE